MSVLAAAESVGIVFRPDIQGAPAGGKRQRGGDPEGMFRGQRRGARFPPFRTGNKDDCGTFSALHHDNQYAVQQVGSKRIDVGTDAKE
jgi:hypothetical protein